VTDYFKYLPVSSDDERWGLNVLNVGCTNIRPGIVYPRLNHPAHHYFNWSRGRVFHEYQLIYITRGEGIFESEHSGTSRVAEGTIIVLFPGERHRYKPDTATGWDEFWIGFDGKIMSSLQREHFFTPENPILSIGFDESLLALFLEVIDRAKEEKTGYQPLVAGMVLHMLGYIRFLSKQHQFSGENTAGLVNKARLLFRSRLEENVSPEDIAKELNISYSKFRKIFKAYTGLAPGQFQIQIRIHKAKELLLDPSRSIKEIAYHLNFDSNFYFSKLFKEKTGFTPLQFRNNALKK
jgi:AraC-like DNA-binding protein